jgi:hypothetical protein
MGLEWRRKLSDIVYSGKTGQVMFGQFNSTTAGYGIETSAVERTRILSVFADDGGDAQTPVGSVPDIRGFLSRYLVTASQAAIHARIWGLMGQAKLYNALFSEEQLGGVNGRLEVVQSGAGTVTLAGYGVSAGVCGIFATAGTALVNTNHIVAGVAAIADIKGTITQTGKVCGFYVGKYDTTNWSDATTRANWGYGLYVDEDSVTVCPIQVGKFVASAAAGGGFAVSLANSAALRIYAEVTADLTNAAMVRSILGRMLVTGAIISNAEVFGVAGQLVTKAATLTHDNAGVLGTFEAQTTAVTIDGTGGDNCTAAVLGRVGVSVTATTVSATGILAGVAAMSNITSGYVSVTSGGILAAFYAGIYSTKQKWDIGLCMPAGTVVTGIRVGKFASAGATGSAIPFATGQDFYADGQLDTVGIFGESSSDLGAGYSAKCGRFRHLVNSTNVTHETYGVMGQIVAKSSSMTHLHAGLIGTFEGHTSGVTLNSAYVVGHAAVTARVGGHAAITATTPLAGFLAFNNAGAALAAGSSVALATSCYSTSYPWTMGIYMPFGTVTTAIRVGNWVGSAALGSAIRFSTAHDYYADGQLDVVAVFAESNADLTSAYSAKAGRYRHVINGITCAHEAYGLIGQVVAKNVTYAHLHSGLMGTFEVNTAATVSAGDAVGCAGVIARIGGATITVGATGVLAGFLSVNIATTVSITSGGVHAAFACRKAGSGVTWAEALHIEDALVAIRFKAASDTYAHGIKAVAAAPSGNTSHALKVMIGTTAGYIPVYDNENF